ncbi:4a-hydroxytetrahydrobiopterin dehydratase [Pontiella sp.]|uniref:4a-hydroxytetrahydrobiopterin dehydratase n=1 Tax=Pontiella sp. TaxID=2837462 RepID=UPI0035668816
MSDLKSKSCKACAGGVEPLTSGQADELLQQLDGWMREGKEIFRTFTFKNYYETMAFVNASAYVSHREDHHPDLEVGYKTCRVTYTTHAIGGLSENDFICAAKLDALL